MTRTWVPLALKKTGLATTGHTNSRGSSVAAWSYNEYATERDDTIAGYGLTATVVFRETARGHVNCNLSEISLVKQESIEKIYSTGVKTKAQKLIPFPERGIFGSVATFDHAHIVAALIEAGQGVEAARVYQDAIEQDKKNPKDDPAESRKHKCDLKLWHITAKYVEDRLGNDHMKEPEKQKAIVDMISSFIQDEHYEQRIANWKLPQEERLYISDTGSGFFMPIGIHQQNEGGKQSVTGEWGYYPHSIKEFNRSRAYMYPQFTALTREEVFAKREEYLAQFKETPKPDIYDDIPDSREFKSVKQRNQKRDEAVAYFNQHITGIEDLLGQANSARDIQYVKEIFIALAKPIKDRVLVEAIPALKDSYGWLPKEMPDDLSVGRSQYVFNELPESLQGAYKHVIAIEQNIAESLSKYSTELPTQYCTIEPTSSHSYDPSLSPLEAAAVLRTELEKIAPHIEVIRTLGGNCLPKELEPYVSGYRDEPLTIREEIIGRNMAKTIAREYKDINHGFTERTAAEYAGELIRQHTNKVISEQEAIWDAVGKNEPLPEKLANLIVNPEYLAGDDAKTLVELMQQHQEEHQVPVGRENTGVQDVAKKQQRGRH